MCKFDELFKKKKVDVPQGNIKFVYGKMKRRPAKHFGSDWNTDAQGISGHFKSIKVRSQVSIMSKEWHVCTAG
jgi:hypothetical protein